VARQLPAVVQRLGEAGFTIYANGKRPRLARDLEVKVTSGVDWFELAGGAAFESDGQTVVASLQKVVDAIADRSPFVVLDDGTLGLVPEEWLTKYHGLTRAVALADDGLRFTRERAALLDAVLRLVDEVRVDAAFAKARRELRKLDGVRQVVPGKKFRGELRPYQSEGLAWLTALDRFDLHGCLADEMGLGKTVQVLAWIATRRRKGPVLVVCPRSVVHNWVDEAAKFTPSLSVYAYVDSQRSSESLATADIVVTSYGTMVRDIGLLTQRSFDLAVLDEAQVIKNATTVTARAARSLIATRRLAASGTPIENHLGELWSIFEFLSPGLLGTTKFQRLIEADARRPESGMRKLIAAAMRPFILRRTKSEVAPDLPDKQEQTVLVELTAQQRVIYEAMLTTYREALFAKVDGDGLAGSTTHILEALLRLRQAACHPALISSELAHADSGKLDALFGMLDDVAQGEGKVLVFSQFTALLELVRQRLASQGIQPAYLDGQTKNRAAVVKRFQNDAETRLMLVSLKAGGTGLNLTAADYVFVLDPWWNPAAEAQAIDRAHRIGRTRPVFAYRLVARGTIEERILDLQRVKAALADAILGGKTSSLKGMTRADLEALFA
jgi:SNF2 family DNA or RNA helicase